MKEKEAPKPVVATPRERRVPLARVVFRVPVDVPGAGIKHRTFVAGETIPDHITQGPEGVRCPALFLDPDLGAVCIGDDLYPFDGALVEKVTRARAAKGNA